MIGRTLEHYRIESKLGEGGMGVVYKAHDTRLDRPWPSRSCRPRSVADPAAKQRFVQEAKAASALNHPGIVTIHDIRSDAGTDFIVMEYVDGKTLDELIPAKGMRAVQALRYAVQIADALAAAHGAGIVHRDLKPSNVMVTPRRPGQDSGLRPGQAARAGGHVVRRDDLSPRRSPRSGCWWARPPTCRPNRRRGGSWMPARTSSASAPCSTRWRPVSRPFTRRFGALAPRQDSQRGAEAADARSSPSIPPELEKIILRCLRKDPSRRYQTMADLKVALEDLEAGTESPARARQRPLRAPSRWRWAWAALLPIVLAAGYFGWQTWRPAEPAEPLRADALTTFPGQELYPSLSPDGNHVVFTWTGPRQDNTDIYVQQIGAGSPLRLTTDPRSDYNPVWSPDGRWIAFLRGDPATPLARSDREVRLIPPLGGPERKLADVRVQEITVNPVYLAWCPDSTCVIVTDTRW